MNRKSHIILLVASLSVLASCCRKDPAPTPAESTDPIHVSATTGWPEIAKSASDTKATDAEALAALQGSGFLVWGTWTKDPDDPSYFTGDYSTGSNPAVFSKEGTPVSWDSSDGWTYRPIRYWYRGTYTFAALAAPPVVNDDENITDLSDIATITYPGNDAGNKTLTVTFTDGLNLAANQIDLMTAFSSGTYQVTSPPAGTYSYDGAPVSLTFHHQLSKVSIHAIDKDPDIDYVITKITLYGNASKVSSMTSTFSADNKISTEFIIKERTSESAPYKKVDIELTTGEQPNYITQTYTNLLSGLLVIPEILGSDTPLYIGVTYHEYYKGKKLTGDSGITKPVQLNSESEVSWLPGYSYLYQLDISSNRIDVTGSLVTDWISGPDIDHEFN